MRVTLVHNPKAGNEEHSAEELTASIERAGHEVRYQSVKEDGWETVFADPTDLVVAAGGDGTVRRVFRELVGKTWAATTILPLGSANNVARTLGIDLDVERLVEGWSTGAESRYDIGRLRSSWGSENLVESVGGGVFAEVIRRAEAEDPGSGEDGLQLLDTVLSEAPAFRWELELDGRDVSDELLAVEVMNIREIGPNVPLAPAASPADELLDLVTIGPDDRDLLRAYLDARIHDRPAAPPGLACRRGKDLLLQVPAGCPFHVDDQLWPEGNGQRGTGEAAVTFAGPPLRLLLAGR